MNKYFSDPKSLETKDLMAFVYPMLDREAGEIGSDSKYHYSKEAIENLINSAFNVGFVSKGDINYKDVIIYKDGQYSCDAWDDTQNQIDAYPYKITWIAPHILRICFNMIDWNLYSSVNCGKAQIILVENKASKFGFTIQSLTVTKSKKPVFTNAQASSFLSSRTNINAYIPTNIIDKKSKTAWATDKGVGQWIKITSKSTQTVTGMDIQAGDRSGDDDRAYNSGQPSEIKLEFSDGTTIERELELPEYSDNHFCISFGREIKTTYIKITILSVSDVATTKDVYISEIIPF